MAHDVEGSCWKECRGSDGDCGNDAKIMAGRPSCPPNDECDGGTRDGSDGAEDEFNHDAGAEDEGEPFKR